MNNIFLFLQEHVCNDTLRTLEKVPSCPTNEIDFQERSQRKMCHRFLLCNNETSYYHCVKYQNILVEICAPSGYIKGNIKHKLKPPL